MSAKVLSRKVHIYINGKEIEGSLKSLQKASDKLHLEQEKMIIGSEEYIQTSLKIKEIDSVIKDHRRAIQEASQDWKDAKDSLAKYSGIFIGLKNAKDMIDGYIGKLKDLAADAAKLDDVYADVQKTTGLTHEEVEKLNEAFKKMDTRTSREQLNQLAYDAAKLDKKTNQQSFSTTFYKYIDPKKFFFEKISFSNILLHR